MQALAEALRELAARGGESRLLVGLDFDRTTRQGVDLALRLFDDVLVVHDVDGRTFHPKLYLATGRTCAYALVGSNNLTGSGLRTNYEGAIALTSDPRREPGMRNELTAYADALMADGNVCKPLTPALRDKLVARGMLPDEAAQNRERRRSPARGGRGRTPLFTPSSVPKHPPPRGDSGPTVDRWIKQLRASDAQRSPKGQRTGVVRLTAPRSAPQPATWFRDVFFAGETWRPDHRRGRAIQTAIIQFDVELGRRRLGRHVLELDYAPHRAAGRRPTTVLHWGSLMPEVRARDYTGWHLIIEPAADTYRLCLARSPPR